MIARLSNRIAYAVATLALGRDEPGRHQRLEGHMPRYMTVLAVLSIGLLGALLGNAKPLSAAEPKPGHGDRHSARARPDDDRARGGRQRAPAQGFPQGLCSGQDATHRTSRSLQRYVKTADLDKVYEAVGKVLAEEKPTRWKLKAYKYYYIPWKDIGLAGIVIEPTDDLIRYQKKLIDAVAPFTVKTGTAAAFVTTKEDPEINQPTIDYVADFVPNESGEKFNPHVTIGLAPQDYLNKMLDEKFEAFTFSPVGASVYHLGNFGTARKKLKSWELKP